jgi:hypothetical protein
MSVKDKHNTGDDTNLNVPAGAITKRAQTFSAQYTYSCRSLRLKLSRVGSPGTITVKVYDTASFPAAENLQGTATYDGDTLTTSSSGEWVAFDFGEGSEFAVSSGTQYWVLMETPSNGGVSDYVRWRTDTSSGYAHGTFYYYFGSWTFTAANDAMFEMGDTLLGLPGKATNPSPANSATGVTLNQASLDWTLGTNAATEDVYFGLSGNMALVDTLNNSETFALTDYLPLPYNTAYQWRIDSVNAEGTTTGDTWSFTTLSLTPPTVANFQIIKRLVAAAADTFWYEDI